MKGITALRLDALLDASLPAKGPGRAADGSFQLSEISVTAAPLDGKGKPAPVKLKASSATFEAKDHPLKGSVDADKKTGWSVQGQAGKEHSAAVRPGIPSCGL